MRTAQQHKPDFSVVMSHSRQVDSLVSRLRKTMSRTHHKIVSDPMESMQPMKITEDNNEQHIPHTMQWTHPIFGHPEVKITLNI